MASAADPSAGRQGSAGGVLCRRMAGCSEHWSSVGAVWVGGAAQHVVEAARRALPGRCIVARGAVPRPAERDQRVFVTASLARCASHRAT
eukprot:350073-Chlamydomonas_euryale.AAC.4